jgi:hypothetical protein
MPLSDVPTICPFCSNETLLKKQNQASCNSQDDHEFWFFRSHRTNKVIWYIEIDEYIIDPRGIRMCTVYSTHRPLIVQFTKSIPLEQAVSTLKRFIAMKAFS